MRRRDRLSTTHQLFEAFLSDCRRRAEGGDLAPSTVDAYAWRLHRAAVPDVALTDLTADDLLDWQEDLPQQRTAYVRCAVGIVVQAFRWARRRRYLHASPDDALVRRAPRREPVRALDAAGLREFLRRCQDEQARRAVGRTQLVRARETSVAAALEAITRCGARQGAVRTMRPTDVHAAERRADVTTKGGRVAIPLSGPLLQLLERRSEMVAGVHAYLFPGAGRGPLTDRETCRGLPDVTAMAHRLRSWVDAMLDAATNPDVPPRTFGELLGLRRGLTALMLGMPTQPQLECFAAAVRGSLAVVASFDVHPVHTDLASPELRDLRTATVAAIATLGGGA